MQDQEKRRRRYRSTLRNAQADATRQRVVAAAGRCFAIRGFTATTLGAIADEAGVSVETVQAHGPKRMLLLAAVETASAGVDGGRSILDVPEARAVLEQTSNAEAVAGLASFAAELNRRVGALWQALAAAAQGDSDLAEAYAGLQERIRADFAKVVQVLQTRSGLRTDLEAEEMAATLLVLTSPHQYDLLVVQAGWEQERYRGWLERMLAEAVLVR